MRNKKGVQRRTVSRIPAVSETIHRTPPKSIITSTISRVVPAMGDTIAASRLANILSRLDLPALRGQMMAMVTPCLIILCLSMDDGRCYRIYWQSV